MLEKSLLLLIKDYLINLDMELNKPNELIKDNAKGFALPVWIEILKKIYEECEEKNDKQ